MYAAGYSELLYFLLKLVINGSKIDASQYNNKSRGMHKIKYVYVAKCIQSSKNVMEFILRFLLHENNKERKWIFPRRIT